MKTVWIAGAVVAAAGAGAWWAFGPTQEPSVEQATTAPVASGDSGQEMVAVTMPALEGEAAMGQRVFTSKCASCHGPNAGGIEGAGPPLIHKIYEPGHHGDMAFYLAAAQGVRAHHWKFGNMPPVEGISEAEVGAVVRFVRRVQAANGID
ncbi:c-type cytochrome [Maritimibacter sp. UBA3975]|uniref:c-type cytochrome n=1 Tax=Maritimibacter sp. UBA3975 TaxID=1946833 RepID=UPI000C0B2090|nr:c-type cytochrome [Maritimibacter sp. UBA3975]MAM61671.1 cytochrome C [Maritimibacter sp.]|tara:strand:- start:326 stop:775 length:450 start_codon:yes stop_codon:yes gene_type:complete